VLGALGDVYLRPGQWQLMLSSRSQRADQFYSGSERSAPEGAVVRRDYAAEVAATYALSGQGNLTLGIPITSQSLNRRAPFPSGPYDEQQSRGIGDFTLVTRYWLQNRFKSATGNVSVGLGLKFPTGNDSAVDQYRNSQGQDPQVKPVSGSLQPGQGGYGAILDLQAFRDLGGVTLFASGYYLINPRNTTNTYSLAVGLNGVDNTPANARYNSVPDLYVARVGLAAPFRPLKGVSMSLAGRMEGSPRRDLVGKSDGWRLAGYGVFVEPGLSYSNGPDTWAFNLPLRVHQYHLAAPGVVRETFADEVFLFSYSTRMGKR